MEVKSEVKEEKTFPWTEVGLGLALGLALGAVSTYGEHRKKREQERKEQARELNLLRTIKSMK